MTKDLSEPLEQAHRHAAAGRARPVRDGVALGLAAGSAGLAFGAAAVGSGLTVAQACVLSLLAFTGASQFALVGTLAGGGSLIGGVAGAVLLGSRNTLYGLRMTGVLERPRGARRLLIAPGVIDETTALSLAQPDAKSARLAFRATFATAYLTWNLATLLGAYGAGRAGSPQSLGLDVVGPAAFLALIWPQLRAGRTERAVALLAAAIALTATPFLPPGVPVILAATAALAGALASPGGRGTTDPGTTDPGTTNSGTTDPGTTPPDMTNSGTTDPGTTDPGTTDPGTTDPGTTDPGTAGPGTARRAAAP